jgi:hypothetical protein
MDPEQAIEHSEEVDASDLEKIKGLMDDNGDIPDHSETADEEEAPAPEKKAPDTPEPEKTEPQGQPDLVEVEDDKGQKVKIPSALKDAFLRQADYTRKTQEIAKERAAAQQERQALQRLTQQASQVGEYQAALKQIDVQLQQFNGVNWQQLYATDRQQYLELRQMASELSQTRQNIVGQMNHFQQQVYAYEAQKNQEAVQKGLQEIRKVIPDFNSDHQKALVETAHSFGFTPEETAQVVDPRQVLILHELKTLRDKVKGYEEKEAAAAKQVRAAPRMVKPQAAPDPSTQPLRNDALNRLKKTHSDDDAVAAIKHLLG